MFHIVTILCLSLALILGGEPASARAESSEQALAAVERIARAETPMDVIRHFDEARDALGDQADLYEAYVRRMAELGVPELAAYRAGTLVEMRPASGVGWAVMAVGAAVRDELPEAVNAIARAADFAPDDEIVASIAGSILAWHDRHERRGELADDLAEQVETVWRALAGERAFLDAYRESAAAYAMDAEGGADEEGDVKAEAPPAAFDVAPEQEAVEVVPSPTEGDVIIYTTPETTSTIYEYRTYYYPSGWFYGGFFYGYPYRYAYPRVYVTTPRRYSHPGWRRRGPRWRRPGPASRRFYPRPNPDRGDRHDRRRPAGRGPSSIHPPRPDQGPQRPVIGRTRGPVRPGNIDRPNARNPRARRPQSEQRRAGRNVERRGGRRPSDDITRPAGRNRRARPPRPEGLQRARVRRGNAPSRPSQRGGRPSGRRGRAGRGRAR